MEVPKKQNDVYGQALWIIVRQCNLYAEFARRVLDDADHSEWGTVESFDHRTLQGAHDLLAAVWRFRNDFRQSELPFVNKNSLDEVQELWLDRVLPRLVLKYTLRAAHLELGGAEQEVRRGGKP